jgi:hypothetical protein
VPPSDPNQVPVDAVRPTGYRDLISFDKGKLSEKLTLLCEKIYHRCLENSEAEREGVYGRINVKRAHGLGGKGLQRVSEAKMHKDAEDIK